MVNNAATVQQQAQTPLNIVIQLKDISNDNEFLVYTIRQATVTNTSTYKIYPTYAHLLITY